MFHAWKRLPASAVLPLVGTVLPLVGTESPFVGRAVSRVGAPHSVAVGLESTSLAAPRASQDVRKRTTAEFRPGSSSGTNGEGHRTAGI